MGRYGYGGYDGGWAPYVPVAQRRRQAEQEMKKLCKKGVDVQPVVIEGTKIAKTFWGKAWCDHLESFSDFENRLPRGRTYVRNGSVCHLALSKGKIEAKVSGSELYTVEITVKTLPAAKWEAIKGRCSGQIGTLLELLQGRLSDHVMEVVTDRKEGLFPLPGEIKMACSCPDWATMCKHVAAVLYGVGARLDNKPKLLFALRGVDHEELIQADAEQAVSAATSRGKTKRLDAAALGDVFGIEIDAAAEASPPPAKSTPTRKKAKSTPPADKQAAATAKTTRKSKTPAKAITAPKSAEPRAKLADGKRAAAAAEKKPAASAAGAAKPAKKSAARAAKKPPAAKPAGQAPEPAAARDPLYEAMLKQWSKIVARYQPWAKQRLIVLYDVQEGKTHLYTYERFKSVLPSKSQATLADQYERAGEQGQMLVFVRDTASKKLVSYAMAYR